MLREEEVVFIIGRDLDMVNEGVFGINVNKMIRAERTL